MAEFQVHYNINREKQGHTLGLWVVKRRAEARVSWYGSSLVLSNCRFHHGTARALETVRTKRQKSVLAWIIGTRAPFDQEAAYDAKAAAAAPYLECSDPTSSGEWEIVRYNPFLPGTLSTTGRPLNPSPFGGYFRRDRDGARVERARRVYFPRGRTGYVLVQP